MELSPGALFSLYPKELCIFLAIPIVLVGFPNEFDFFSKFTAVLAYSLKFLEDLEFKLLLNENCFLFDYLSLIAIASWHSCRIFLSPFKVYSLSLTLLLDVALGVFGFVFTGCI
jgi:hypothetical protein